MKFREPEWIARMETVLEVLNEGVVIADDRPRILFANTRFVEVIGIALLGNRSAGLHQAAIT